MIVVAGESLIDFIERASHGPNPTYEACPGGSPFNCALALGRLGASVGFVGPFSRDRLGILMRERLEAVGARALIAAPSERLHSPCQPVDLIVDPVGAGDGFDAGFVAGRLMGWDLARSAELGNVVGATALGVRGDFEGYPTLAEAAAALAGRPIVAR